MKAKNSSERSKAFSNFLILFIITIGIILTCVFFSFQVPLKENEQLRADRDTLLEQQDNQKKFVDILDKTMNLLDTVNQPQVKAEIVDVEINANLESLGKLAKNDPANRKLFLDIMVALSDLKKAKQQLRDLSGKDLGLAELRSQNQDLERQLDQAKKDYDRVNNEYSKCMVVFRNSAR